MFEIADQESADDCFVLDAATALDMADERNILYIQGSAGDTLAMAGDWTRVEDRQRGEDGRLYQLFTTEREGRLVEVYVGSDILLRS